MDYLIAFLGSLIYNFILFKIAKDECDNNDKDFPYVKYCKMNWDNWTLTAMLAPVLVLYMVDIVAIINKQFNLELSVYEVYYLGVGVLTELVLFGVSKLLGWKKTWVAPVHIDEPPKK